MPEVFGDAILVNGKIFPYLDVEPHKYRFRVLNGANGRFFHLTLSAEKPSSEKAASGKTPVIPILGGQGFHQIGSDQGLLSAPVPLKLFP